MKVLLISGLTASEVYPTSAAAAAARRVFDIV